MKTIGELLQYFEEQRQKFEAANMQEYFGKFEDQRIQVPWFSVAPEVKGDVYYIYQGEGEYSVDFNSHTCCYHIGREI